MQFTEAISLIEQAPAHELNRYHEALFAALEKRNLFILWENRRSPSQTYRDSLGKVSKEKPEHKAPQANHSEYKLSKDKSDKRAENKPSDDEPSNINLNSKSASDNDYGTTNRKQQALATKLLDKIVKSIESLNKWIRETDIDFRQELRGSEYLDDPRLGDFKVGKKSWDLRVRKILSMRSVAQEHNDLASNAESEVPSLAFFIKQKVKNNNFKTGQRWISNGKKLIALDLLVTKLWNDQQQGNADNDPLASSLLVAAAYTEFEKIHTNFIHNIAQQLFSAKYAHLLEFCQVHKRRWRQMTITYNHLPPVRCDHQGNKKRLLEDHTTAETHQVEALTFRKRPKAGDSDSVSPRLENSGMTLIGGLVAEVGDSGGVAMQPLHTDDTSNTSLMDMMEMRDGWPSVREGVCNWTDIIAASLLTEWESTL